MRRTIEVADVPVGNECWIPGYGRYAVVDRGYYLTVLVKLDADGVPMVGSLCSVADCVLAYNKGPSRHVTACEGPGRYGMAGHLLGLR